MQRDHRSSKMLDYIMERTAGQGGVAKTFLQAINVSSGSRGGRGWERVGGARDKGRTTISSSIWANQFRRFSLDAF